MGICLLPNITLRGLSSMDLNGSIRAWMLLEAELILNVEVLPLGKINGLHDAIVSRSPIEYV